MQIRKSEWNKFKKESEENEINEKTQMKEKLLLIRSFTRIWCLFFVTFGARQHIVGFHLTSSLPCWCTEQERKKSSGNLTQLLCQTWAKFVLNLHCLSAILFLLNFFRSLGWNLARPKTLYLRGNEQLTDRCTTGEEIRQLGVWWLWNWTAHALDFWSQINNITERDWRSAMGNADW